MGGQTVLIQANALHLPMADKSVHTVVTSPPYWGLRNYQLPPLAWGGDPGCEHEWADASWRDSRKNDETAGPKQRSNAGSEGWRNQVREGAFCSRCKSWRGSLGLEPTPELYVQHLVDISREIRRVLRNDGVLWMNLADCHHSGDRGGYRLDSHRWEKSELQSKRADRGGSGIPLAPNRLPQDGLSDGDLVGIPFRVAFALQADGWRLRQVHHWWKLNPMPQSVGSWQWEQHRVKIGRKAAAQYKPAGWDTRDQPHDSKDGRYQDRQHEIDWKECDGCKLCLPNDGLVLRKASWRHTSAVEYVFMLTNRMHYWGNGLAAKEASTERPSGNTDRRLGDDYDRPDFHVGHSIPYEPDGTGRNPRNFTLLATEAYRGAHYATFPTSLVSPLIAATCPKRACPSCGQGWAPVIKRERYETSDYDGKWRTQDPNASGRRILANVHGARLAGGNHDNPFPVSTILAWKPSCLCGLEESIPGIVIDPFCGSGTTGEVCNMLGLRFVGIDLSMPYLRDQAAVRVEHRAIDTKVEDLPLFAGCPKEVHNDAETTVGNPKEA